MPCTDDRRTPGHRPCATREPVAPCRAHRPARGRPALWALTGLVVLLSGCGMMRGPQKPGSTAPAPAPTVPGTPQRPTPAPAPTPPVGTAPAATPAPAARPPVGLAAPKFSATWTEYRRQAAERIVAASPGQAYMTTPPEPLLAIPVLEVILRRDGSVRDIVVLRKPTQAHDTIELAKEAIRRGAPYGPVSHLEAPWKFVEVFLFDDERRFKPRTLD